MRLFFLIIQILFWLIILSYFHEFFNEFFYFIFITFITWSITRFFKKNKIKNLFNNIFASLLIFFVFIVIYKVVFSINPSNNKKEGSVTVYKPKKIIDLTSKNKIDYKIEKKIWWYDFYANIYNINYSTRYFSFLETKQNHKNVEYEFRSTTPESIQYYNKLYMNLIQFDNIKIDSIINLIAKESKDKKLNQLQTAEMVTTFIQEIPYVLVHQNSCKQIFKYESPSSYIVKYHNEKKPCLANIPGGVQSPYEFLHNLKGDCDTRTLLAFAILNKLKISSSIWVSKAYGHSVLGIGLPVGNGIYKSIDGLNHYGVELTNKGFRLGMISPHQRDISNWDIALYSNNF